MLEFVKPVVLISKCIEFEYCRWNGMIIKSPIVKILKSYVDFQPVCAEVEIGLGIPRDPVRLIKENDSLNMIQPSTNRNFTSEMTNFTKEYLNTLDHVDGFILKSDSPSCGLFHTKYYPSAQKGARPIERGAGLFGKAILEKFSNKAIETDGRLTNFRIREYWLTKLFTLAEFHRVKNSHSKHELVQFHTKNKFLFMAYNQVLMREAGRIIANPHKNRFETIVDDYEQKLIKILKKPPNYTSHINTILHTLGFFKKNLSHEEKGFFLDELENYRAGWIPLFVLLNLIKSWTVRFSEEYLKGQTYFNLYPEELMNFDLKDSWRGRSYWE